MATLPLALSVHHFVSSVGADAGFAAIIGLAILVLLYFAQARETANLREQAYESSQRVAQLETRLTSLARQQSPAGQPAVAARPASVAASRGPAPARAPVFAGAAAVAPGPPAGVAAPALSAATKLIPTTPVAPPEPEPLPEPEEGPAQPSDLTELGGMPPATVAGANGDGNGVGSPPRVSPPARVTPPPARAGRAAQVGRRPVTPPPSEPPPKRRTGLRIAIAVVGALVVAGIVVVLLKATSSGGSPSNSSNASVTNNATAATRRKRAVAVTPSTVTVAVLNGTATNGLAGRVSNRLTGAGYKQGRVATASDQTRTATIVAYLPGDKRDALVVAQALKLGPASVQPIDPSTQAVACPGSTTCPSQVVVTVGTDLAA